MTWQNPLAWIGIVAISLPILIHLLGQGRARRQPFPTLRFFGDARPLPTQRTRLHDLLLLAVRVAIFVAAVAALAQPLLITANRKRAFNTSLARAVIVDSSSSMRTVLAAATKEARAIADSGAPGVVLSTALPARAIPGAVAWLRRQPGRNEIVIVSDFQAGTLDSSDIGAVPTDIGVRLIRIPRADAPTSMAIHTEASGHEFTARFTLTPDGTNVEWSHDPPRLGEDPYDIQLLAAPSDVAATNATQVAAATVAVLSPVAIRRHIAIIVPNYPDRTALQQRATPIHSEWMADVVARIGADSTIVARADSDRLLLFSSADAGSLASASLVAAVRRALSIAPPVAELDPAFIPDKTLTAWQRPPLERSPNGPDVDGSDGHWIWVAVLALLAVEWLLRRSMKPQAIEVARDAAI